MNQFPRNFAKKDIKELLNMGENSQPLRIAIAGAGIAGLTTAIALRQHPNIQVELYERASELKEIGASIALGPNGLRTLQRLGLDNAISDEVGFRGPSNIAMIYRHWKTNEVIGKDVHENVTEHLHQTSRYHRAHLHQALLETVPKEIVHLGKKLVAAEVNDEGVTLKFKDGTSVTADILLGADGLRSGVRQAFVPDFELKWSGWTAFRAIFDSSLVKSIPDVPVDSAHWWGPDTTFFASYLGKNAFTVVGGVYKDPQTEDANVEWDQEASVKLLRDTYADWHPVIKNLVDVTPEVRYFPNYTCASSLSTWNFGNRVTLIGDAAHAHGGAHATGGSIAIDDAYAFYLALTSVYPIDAKIKPSVDDIGRAINLYEATRKPHADRLLAKVRAANVARAARVGKNETDEELRSRAAKGSDTKWLHEHDVVAAFEETLKKRELPTQDGWLLGRLWGSIKRYVT